MKQRRSPLLEKILRMRPSFAYNWFRIVQPQSSYYRHCILPWNIKFRKIFKIKKPWTKKEPA